MILMVVALLFAILVWIRIAPRAWLGAGPPWR